MRDRVVIAAEAALADHDSVSPLDIFLGVGWLHSSSVEGWRRCRIPSIEQAINASEESLAVAVETLHEWARARGLIPTEAAYRGLSRGAEVELRFTGAGRPDDERIFRTHFASPAMGERKRAAIEKKAAKPPDRLAYLIVRDSRCSECGAELLKGEMLTLEAGQALCMACSGLSDLEYLEAGNSTLTRRARKKSSRPVVVLRFSRSRGRYERQGILVEPDALEEAERECEADAAERAARRAAAGKVRKQEDERLIAQMTLRILELYPGCPPGEARAIAAHTAVRGSGRVGRTAAGRGLEERAMAMAVAAAVRHRHTNYDELLAKGADRESARARVAGRVNDVLEKWSGVDCHTGLRGPN